MTNDTDIELVARALCIDDGRNPDQVVNWTTDSETGEKEALTVKWHLYKSNAEAAIAAIQPNADLVALVAKLKRDMSTLLGTLDMYAEGDFLDEDAAFVDQVRRDLRSSPHFSTGGT